MQLAARNYHRQLSKTDRIDGREVEKFVFFSVIALNCNIKYITASLFRDKKRKKSGRQRCRKGEYLADMPRLLAHICRCDSSGLRVAHSVAAFVPKKKKNLKKI